MSDTGHLKTQANELVKQHCEYDNLGRVTDVYTVRSDASNGVPCSIVKYSYDGNSSRVIFMKEGLAIWDGSWDVFPSMKG